MRAASIERPRDSGGGAASASHGFWSHSIADGPTTVAPLTEASDARAEVARRNEDNISITVAAGRSQLPTYTTLVGASTSDTLL